MMNEDTKGQVVSRLKRVSGQLAGVARMVEDERYCVDLLLQITSAQAALGQASKLILHSHVDTCVREAREMGKPVERRQKLAELMDVFTRYGCLGGRAPRGGQRTRRTLKR